MPYLSSFLQPRSNQASPEDMSKRLCQKEKAIRLEEAALGRLRRDQDSQ